MNMKNEIQQNHTPTQENPRNPVLPVTNRLKILLFILLGLIVIAVSAFVYIQVSKRKIPNPSPIAVATTPTPTVLPSPTIVVTPTAPPSPTAAVTPTGQTSTPVRWLVYTHTKFPDLPDWKIPWKGFKFYYPSSWALEVSRDEDEPGGPFLSLQVTKNNGDYFRIAQAMGGGGYCIFPDSPEYNTFDGMGGQYDTFKEIRKSNGIIWRLADRPTPNDPWTHELCEKRNGGYIQTTVIGFTQIKAATPKSVQELYEILNKIEITD